MITRVGFSGKSTLKKYIHNLDFYMLLLLIFCLPSLEAPKNVFLVLFLLAGLVRQIYEKEHHRWRPWDWIFLFFIGSAFLTTLFPAMHNDEWRGLRILLSSTLVGWLIIRSHYSANKISWLFVSIIFSVIPPLILGFIEYLYLHHKSDLQLHSVGHVNHSAIYLTIILGSAVGLLISSWKKNRPYQNTMLSLLCAIFLISLIISQSRAAVGIGIFLSISLFLILSQNFKIKISGILTVLFIVACSIFLNVGIVQKEIRNEQANNFLASRDKVWNVSYEAARWAPILGIGINNWGKIKPEDIKLSLEARGRVYNENNYAFQSHSHSLYLTAFVERGALGFFSLMLLMIGWLYYLIKQFKKLSGDDYARYLWAGSFSAWVVTFGIGFVNTTFHHEHAILACILLGLFVTYMTFNKKNCF